MQKRMSMHMNRKLKKFANSLHMDDEEFEKAFGKVDAAVKRESKITDLFNLFKKKTSPPQDKPKTNEANTSI